MFTNSQVLMLNPIVVRDITIHQPTVKEILEIGEGVFDLYTSLFTNINMIKNQHGLSEDIRDFGVFFELNENQTSYKVLLYEDTPLLYALADSIRFFTKCNKIQIDINKKHLILDESKIIDSFKYDEISEVILQMIGMEKSKIEKPPVFKNEKQRQIYEKIMNGRKKKSEKEHVEFKTMIAIIRGELHESYESIGNMTYLQFIDSYLIAGNKHATEIKLSQLSSGLYKPEDLGIECWWSSYNSKS